MNSATGLVLAQANALVCGATGGLGSALAAELHARGARLTLSGRDQVGLAGLPMPGTRVRADLREKDACAQLVNQACEGADGLDLVINAVGVVAFGQVAELAEPVARELLETNVLVPMMLASAALPRMRPGGVIVNISGIISEPGKALSGTAAYAASKAAVRVFDEVLAREARRAQVRVIDARAPHTETGLADRAIAGAPPRLPPGLSASQVARVICDAIERGDRDLPSEAFAV